VIVERERGRVREHERQARHDDEHRHEDGHHPEAAGFRAAWEYLRPYGDTRALPIFQKIFLGGEYSIRGFDIRSVSPRDELSGVPVGGNKSLLFNAEYLIHIAGPVRLVLFADAGQVRDTGENFAWKEPITQRNVQGVLIADSILDPFYIFNPINYTPRVTTEEVGEAAAFKTSIRPAISSRVGGTGRR